MHLLKTTKTLDAIWDLLKSIFICSFLVLKNIFSTHIAALQSDPLNSDLQMSLYCTRNTSSSEYLSRNIL